MLAAAAGAASKAKVSTTTTVKTKVPLVIPEDFPVFFNVEIAAAFVIGSALFCVLWGIINILLVGAPTSSVYFQTRPPHHLHNFDPNPYFLNCRSVQ